ncbi:hypothetical protein AVEN_19815-1 [Araneus ventricosus]|uniref:Uncharacterized protein n=1 Tax=Araneus ventricosus TaxID=182803 RepID=A0A4Y2FSR5_ARAVE|nr:hypothetical protein AVEN_19815-1 [Araneus ventricosus]
MNVTSENPQFEYKTKKIYAMFVPPRLLKSVRNNLKNHGIYYKDTSIGNTVRTAFANWKNIEELYETDSKVVLSHSVISALNLHVIAHRIENNAIDTFRFIKNMDILLILRPASIKRKNCVQTPKIAAMKRFGKKWCLGLRHGKYAQAKGLQYLSSDACNKCTKFLVEEDKILDNHTVFFCVLKNLIIVNLG